MNTEPSIIRPLQREEWPNAFPLIRELRTQLLESELLELDKSGIRVAQFLTELPPRRVFKRKLKAAIQRESAAIGSRG